MEETTRLTKENALFIKEIKRETDRQIEKMRQETDRRIQDTDRKIQDTDRRIQENDRLIKEMRQETARVIKETRDWVNKIEGQFGNQWGELVEALIEGSLLQILNEKGIEVDRLIPNYTGRIKKGEKRREKEFDLIALNGKEAVVVETKSALDEKKAKRFLKALASFKEYCPEYSALTVYGGMAYLRCEKKARKYAEEQGLFVIKVSGKNAAIMNDKSFKPQVFSSPSGC